MISVFIPCDLEEVADGQGGFGKNTASDRVHISDRVLWPLPVSMTS
jgi:hypothetical protein